MPDGSAAEPIVYISAANLKDEGVYYAEVSVNSNDEHYKGSEKTYEYFQISKKSAFADVNASAWYAGAVYQAKELGYVNGISGTNLFAPEADITRADAVCILFNMAGGKVGSNDFSYDEMTGYNTGFSDVDGHSYFAKALAWAHIFRRRQRLQRRVPPLRPDHPRGVRLPAGQLRQVQGRVRRGRRVRPRRHVRRLLRVRLGQGERRLGRVQQGHGNGGFIAAQDNIIRAEVAAMAVNYPARGPLSFKADRQAHLM